VRAIGIFFLLTALAAAWPAWTLAEVKTKVGEDGIPFIYNESSEQRDMRLSGHLQQVSRQDLLDLIVRHADRQRLSQRLVQAVVQVESGYNPNARSHKGAMGLMQLMPDTARMLAVVNPFDPEENVRGGTDYLRSMLDRFGDLQLALAAYNAGPSAVERHRGVPPFRETRRYVERILTLLLDGEAPSLSDRERGTTLRLPPAPAPPSGSSSGGSSQKAKPQGPAPKIYVSRGANDEIVMTTTPPPKKRRP
jgi:Transglycosylase SLT domain